MAREPRRHSQGECRTPLRCRHGSRCCPARRCSRARGGRTGDPCSRLLTSYVERRWPAGRSPRRVRARPPRFGRYEKLRTQPAAWPAGD
jgi:hypothetical protein